MLPEIPLWLLWIGTYAYYRYGLADPAAGGWPKAIGRVAEHAVDDIPALPPDAPAGPLARLKAEYHAYERFPQPSGASKASKEPA